MKIYEKFHKKTSRQTSIINEKNFTYSIIIPVLKKYISKNSNILDFGSGAGTISFYLSKNAKKVVGVDVSEKAIEISKQTKKYLKIKNVDFYLHKNFKSKQKFDYVLLLEVIEHVKEQNKLLKDINKKLKKDGMLILSTPSKNAPLYKLGLTKKFDRRVGHLRRYSDKQLINLLTKNNFEVVEIIPNESVLRNALFIIPSLGFLVRFIKGPLVPLFIYLDKLFLAVFGECDYIVIAKKK